METNGASEPATAAAGFGTACWTSFLIQQLIYQEFGVLYNRHYVCTLMHSLGFSFQKARFESDHLDEKAREEWWTTKWPEIVRLAQEKGSMILFGDEVSFAQCLPWPSAQGRQAAGMTDWAAGDACNAPAANGDPRFPAPQSLHHPL